MTSKTTSARLPLLRAAGSRAVIALFIAIILCLLCQSARAASQTACPVTGKSIDRTIFMDYQGKRIYFSGEESRQMFARDSQHYMELLAQQEVALEQAPSSGLSEKLKMQFYEESQIGRQYAAFAERADRDGYPNVAKLYRAVAEAENIHARRLIDLMKMAKATGENLTFSKEFESFVANDLLPKYEDLAKEEKNPGAASLFQIFEQACTVHAKVFNEALKSVQAGKDLEKLPIYVCPVCGNTVIGRVPENCSICGASSSMFVLIK